MDSEFHDLLEIFIGCLVVRTYERDLDLFQASPLEIFLGLVIMVSETKTAAKNRGKGMRYV